MVILRKFRNVSLVIFPNLFLNCAALWGSRQFSVIFLCNVLLCETFRVGQTKAKSNLTSKMATFLENASGCKANNKKQVEKEDGILC